MSKQKAQTKLQNNEHVRLGEPTLTTTHAIAQSLAIGPVFSAIFLASLIAGAAGGAAPITVVFAAIGALGIGWIITIYARRYYGAGAIYEYLRLNVNPSVGLFSAILYYVGLVFQGAGGVYIAAGITISGFIKDLTGADISWWICGLIMALIIFALNHRGVKIAANFQLGLSILSAIPLVILAIVIVAKGGLAGNTWQAFNPGIVPSAAIFGGILFAITLFTGFETAAALGEETKDPQRSIPTAVMAVLGISIVFYLLVVYASDIGFGLSNSAKWASDSSPLATLATQYVGKWLATLIDLALIFDMIALAMAYSSTTARGWFALARHGVLPSALTSQSKHGTPLGGNIVTLVIAFVMTLVAPIFSIDAMTFFGITVTVGAIFVELIYVFLAVFAVKILVQEKAVWWKWILLVLGIITPALGIKASVWPIPPYPQSISVYATIAVIVIVAIWTAVLSTGGKLAHAGARYQWDDALEEKLTSK